ncbi:MAG: pyridoxal-phosphate dependent enzyme, partial [Phycisphaerales bacterium]
TIADGLLTSLSDLTFGIIRDRVARILTVPEDAIIDAMRFVYERAKIVIEPSAAVGLAALFAREPDHRGLNNGIIICGGNVDLDRLPWQRPA